MLNRNKNLLDMKKNNPQALPPAGKHFYEFPNKSQFLSAQKNGSFAMSPPPVNSYNYNKESFVVNKLKEQSRRSGKKLFPNTFANIYSNSIANQGEMPLKDFKLDRSALDENPAMSKTIDHRQLKYDELNGKLSSHSQADSANLGVDENYTRNHKDDYKYSSNKPPRDPRSYLPSTEKMTPGKAIPQYEPLSRDEERSQPQKPRSSSLSKLGERNYKQMIVSQSPKAVVDHENYYEPPHMNGYEQTMAHNYDEYQMNDVEQKCKFTLMIVSQMRRTSTTPRRAK